MQNLFKNRENWLFVSKRKSIIVFSFYSKMFALDTLAFACAGVGLEPTHSGSWARQANQLLHPAIDWVRASAIFNETAWLLLINQFFLKRKKAHFIWKRAILTLLIAIKCKCAASFTSQTSFTVLILFQCPLGKGVILLTLWIYVCNHKSIDFLKKETTISPNHSFSTGNEMKPRALAPPLRGAKSHSA